MPYANAVAFVYLIMVIIASFSLQNMDHNLATVVMIVTYVVLNSCAVILFYKLREWNYEERSKDVYRIISSWTLFVILTYKTFGAVFRPKWYISILCCSLFYIVARTMTIYFAQDRNFG